MVVNTQINEEQLKTLVASIYKCEPGDIEFQIVDAGIVQKVAVTIKTDLDGAKRAAKILNAGKG